MAEQPIRTLVVDDHPVVRRGLTAFFAGRDGIEVVGEAASGEEAVERAVDLRPDVVVLDLMMPGIGGVATVARLREAVPGARVLVLTSYTREDEVLRAIRAGAAGYLVKDADPEEVEAAVRTVHHGGTVLGAEPAAQLLAAVRDTDADLKTNLLDGLTRREQEILALLAAGRSNREIGGALFIAEKTVKTHVSSILTKLGVRDRTQAALIAARAGLGPET